MVPADTPVMMPEDEPMATIAVLPLAHVPPVTELLNVVVEPIQVAIVPVIAGGGGMTVTMPVTVHPVPESLNVIVEVPAIFPVTIPEDEPMVATIVLLLVHVPEPDELLRTDVPPMQTFILPDIVAGEGFTVTVVTTLQPVLNIT